MKKLKSSVCAVTHAGNVRTENEDNFILNGRTTANGELKKGSAYIQNMYEPFYMTVCDGMGGKDGGELASAIACNSIANHAREVLDAGDNFSAPLANCLREANQSILEEITKSGDRIGTTVASVFASHGKLICVNVGNSRIYRYSNGILEQLSVDHTNGLSAGSADIPDADKLTRHLGIFPDEAPLSPSVCAVDDIEDGDVIILCSDGLTDLVSDDQIRSVASAGENAQEVASRLVKMALRNGGKDNITVIAAFMKVEQAAGFAPVAAAVVGNKDADYSEEYQNNYGREADRKAGLLPGEEDLDDDDDDDEGSSVKKILIMVLIVVLAAALLVALFFGVKTIINKNKESDTTTVPSMYTETTTFQVSTIIYTVTPNLSETADESSSETTSETTKASTKKSGSSYKKKSTTKKKKTTTEDEDDYETMPEEDQTELPDTTKKHEDEVSEPDTVADDPAPQEPDTVETPAEPDSQASSGATDENGAIMQ